LKILWAWLRRSRFTLFSTFKDPKLDSSVCFILNLGPILLIKRTVLFRATCNLFFRSLIYTSMPVVIVLAVLSPENYLSISMPKYLILFCDFIRWPLQLIWNSFMGFSFGCGPKRMHSVLPRFRESWFSIS
jgi:hypothetical protein